jgi:hypothetical protein
VTQTSPSRYPEKVNKTCVLYHGQSGTIVHIHHTIVFEGGYEPTDYEIESMARGSLDKRGVSHADLHALHVPGGHMKPFKAYRVEPARKALVETDLKRKPH